MPDPPSYHRGPPAGDAFRDRSLRAHARAQSNASEARSEAQPSEVYKRGVGTRIAGDSVPPSIWNTFPVTQPAAGEAR